jgi:hypothetical protein
VHELADVCAQASEFVVLSDYRCREAERIEVFEPNGQASKIAREAADRKNAACLELLSEPAHSAINGVQTRFQGMRIDAEPQLAIFHEELRDKLITTDLKAEHVKKIIEIEEQTFSIARESGVDGLCEKLQRDVDEFTVLRTRRPWQNDPVSTVTGGIFVGIGSLVLGICSAVTGAYCRDATVRDIGWGIIGWGIFVAVSGNIYAAAA